MKPLIPVLVGGFALLLAPACTHTPSSTAVRARRPAVEAANVKVYAHAPAKFEEIGQVWADGPVTSSRAQRVSDEAIRSLQHAASKLGANGILFSGTGIQYVSSAGAAFGTPNASQSGIGTSAYSARTDSSTAIFAKKITATAIFVTQE